MMISVNSVKDGNEILLIEYDDKNVTVFPGAMLDVHGRREIRVFFIQDVKKHSK